MARKLTGITQLISGNIQIFSRTFPKTFIAGLIGVIFLYVSVAGMISIDAPWLVRGDTRQHVDYIWRLYNGSLPKISDNITYPPLVEAAGKPNPQAASKNPPLFYLIHAPFEGPLLNRNALNKAIALGRAINLLIGVCCILVLSWAGWIFGGSKKWLMALTVPAFSVLIFRFTRLNVDFAPDVLLVLLGTLSLVFTYKIINNPSRKSLALLTLISALGMFTKISFVIFLATNTLAIFLAFFLKDAKTSPGNRRFTRAIMLSFLALMLVFLACGWYYYIRDYKLSGNWFSAVSSSRPGQGRHMASLLTILTSKKLWTLFYGNFVRNTDVSAIIAGYALAGVVMTRNGYKSLTKDRALHFTFLIMLLSLLGIFLTQVLHASGSGAINFRYLLPVLLPFGIFLSYGLLFQKELRGQVAALAVIIMGLLSIGAYSSRPKASFVGIRGTVTAAHLNGIPTILPLGLIGIFVLGCVLFSVALYRLAGAGQITEKSIS